MIKKSILATCTLLFLLCISSSLDTKALTFNKLPTKQTSKQWSVQVGEAEQSEKLVKPVKGKFHTYSLKIDKLGKDDVDSVDVHMYRNEPDSITKFSLLSCPAGNDCNNEHYERAISLAKQMNTGMPYQFSNFLLAEKATELEVEIVWTENREGRPLKETFTFTSK